MCAEWVLVSRAWLPAEFWAWERGALGAWAAAAGGAAAAGALAPEGGAAPEEGAAGAAGEGWETTGEFEIRLLTCELFWRLT